MDKKKILIVTGVFYPINSPRSHRATELAKEFARSGHNVTVMAPGDSAHHPDFEKKYGIKIKDIGSLKLKPIVIKGKGFINLFWRILARVTSLILVYPDIELFWLVKKALKSQGNYDLMISVAVPYPVHWGVAAVQSENNRIAKVWAADCGDPFMGQENDTFKMPFYFKYVEKWFCRKADFLTVPTIGAINGYYPEFHSKIKVIPQGFNFDEHVFDNQNVPSEKIRFAYAGMFIPGRRDPTEFLKYITSLPTDFEFHIYTSNATLVEPFLLSEEKRIIVHEFIPRHELLEKIASMDFVVNFENVGMKQTPSKLIDYLILNKPILSVLTNNLKTQVIDQFLKTDYSGQYIISNVDQYRIENVCKNFIELCLN